MPVELVPRNDLMPLGSDYYVDGSEDGHRDGAADLGRPSLITEHRFSPIVAGVWWERCRLCGLGEAAHEAVA